MALESVACIRCGADGKAAVIAVDLHDAVIRCSECDNEYDAYDVEDHIAAWQAMLPWLRAHPRLVEEREQEAKDAAAKSG